MHETSISENHDQQDDKEQAPYPLDAFPSPKTVEETTDFPALSIPAKKTAEARRQLSSVLFYRTKMKTVLEDPEDSSRRILLLQKNSDKDTFEHESVLSFLADANNDARQLIQTVRITYDDLDADELLRKILPSDTKEIPSAFETIGSLIHINLREELLPYKYWIGKVLLDKHQPRIKTVVNKVGTIETEYRTFGMEVIAGSHEKGWSEVTVKEENCTFRLDFQTVYWNSRLGGEHRRLVNVIRKEARDSKRATTTVLDLMAGVGPFAIPLTAGVHQGNKKSNASSHVINRVFANDLNPESFRYLQINATDNKCENLVCFNKDARLLVQEIQNTPQLEQVDHVIMNLPASAPEFLDAFRGWKLSKCPRVHVHCFCLKSSESDNYQEAITRCEEALGCTIQEADVHIVRDVSPNKNMLCVSFHLPEAVRTVPPLNLPAEDTTESANKKARIE
jgi:tRNA (guanine37-N1)-methyltransferase